MKKVMSLVMAAAVSASIFAGCGGNTNEGSNNDNTSNGNNTSTGEEDKNEESGEALLRETGGKIDTLNPHMQGSSTEGDVYSYIAGNMLQMVITEDGQGYEIIPYHAKEMPTMSEDGLTWTFELRDGLEWSDGTPITAETYEYSYKTLLDPVLKNTRAFKMFQNVPIKNAEKYYNGEIGWEEVGVKVLEGNKLQIELENPIGEIDFKLVFIPGEGISPVHPEIYESCYNEDRTENSYGTTFETSPSSGPYILTNWVRDQVREYEKNTKDPLADLYKIDKINTRVVEDQTTAMQLFESGEVDYVGVSGENYTKYEEDPRLVFAENASVSSMYINMKSEKNPILTDINFRNALFYGLDRQMLAEDIFNPAKPAPYFISAFNFVDDGLAYRDTDAAKAVVPENNGYDPELSVELFNKAYEANGSQKVTIEMAYQDSSESNKKMAELLEVQYEELFGTDKLDIQLKTVPSNALYDNIRAGNYDISFGGWGGGVFDPWALNVVYTSGWGANKLEQFYNAEFDELYERMVSGDLIFDIEGKINGLARQEELLFEEMPFVPMYEVRKPYLFSDRITLKTGGAYFPIVDFGILQADIAPLQ